MNVAADADVVGMRSFGLIRSRAGWYGKLSGGSTMVSRSFGFIVDLALLCASAIAALVLRNDLAFDAVKMTALLPYLVCMLGVAIAVHGLLGLDKALWKFTSFADCLHVCLAICLTVVGATALIYVYNGMSGVARSIPIIQALIAVFALVGVRVLARLIHERSRSGADEAARDQTISNLRAETVLVIGFNRLAELLVKHVSELSEGRSRVVGVVAHDGRAIGRSLSGCMIVGPDVDFDAMLRTFAVHGVEVDRFMLTVPLDELPPELRRSLIRVAGGRLRRIEHLAEAVGLGDGAGQHAGRATAVSIGSVSAPAGGPLQNIQFTAEQIDRIVSRPYWRLKRAIDFSLALVMLLALLPLLAVLALVVRIGLGSPVYFWQYRTGFNGRPFRLYKFRSMGDAYGADGRPIRPEDRQNAVGRFLRATRLDELPQLWNILIGEMSFIGPRPLLPVDHLDGARIRWLARPGLSGWAQVMGGRHVSVPDKMALDMWYVQNASLRLDIEIVARTIPTVIYGERIDDEAIRRAWAELTGSSGPADPGLHSANLNARVEPGIGLIGDRAAP